MPHGHRDPLPCSCIHSNHRPLTQERREGTQWGAGQMALITCRTWAGKLTEQSTTYTWLALFIPSVFPYLLLLKSPKLLLCPTFGFSCKHPIVSPVGLLVFPAAPVSLQWAATPLVWLDTGQMLCWTSLAGAWIGCYFLGVLDLSSHCAPMLLSACRDGLVTG